MLCKDLLTSTSRTLLQKQATYHHVVCLCSGSTVGETLERSGSGEHGPEVKVSVLIAVSLFFHPSSCYIHLERMACRCLKWPGSTVCVCVCGAGRRVCLFLNDLFHSVSRLMLKYIMLMHFLSRPGLAWEEVL